MRQQRYQDWCLLYPCFSIDHIEELKKVRLFSMFAVLIILSSAALVLVLWSRIEVAKAVSAHPPQGIFVPVTEGRIHLRDIGPRDAPPERTLVFLHGASSNLLALTLPLASRLQNTFRIIAIDRPGHGYSDRPGGRADALPARQAQLVNEAMVSVDVAKAIIVAHSLSGALATTLAMDHPDRVLGLVLLAPVTHPWPGGLTWYYYPASWPVIGWLFSQALPVAGAYLSMKTSLAGVFHPQVPPENYIKSTALKLMLRPANFMANAQDVAALFAHVTARCGRYGGISVPTVVISGEDDQTVYTSIHTVSLGRELPNAKIHILKEVGHMPHHAAPEFVVSEIEALSKRLLAKHS
jgi:pimeloyl-ACP methyl ester carboxylesterase